MLNQDIARIFENMAVYLEIKDDNVFKVRAYRRAADSLQSLTEDVARMKAQGRLDQVPGIGKTLIGKIGEFVETGKIMAYEELKKDIPESILDVVGIPFVGPKKARLFYEALHVADIDALADAVDKGRLEGMPGIKEKTIENIRKGIALMKRGRERMNLGLAVGVADRFISDLEPLPEVRTISVAGSVRRMKETIRDVDILAGSSRPAAVMDRFISLPGVERVLGRGGTKSSVLTSEGVQVDVRVVATECFGSALLYFTGSKNFNIALRQRAMKHKMKISEYGIFSAAGKGKKRLASRTEEDMFRQLGMPYIPPELREDFGEKEIWGLRRTPDLIEESDIRGDLHVHSRWSDGRNTIEAIALAARQRGYGYVAVADHSPKLRVANGVSPENLRKKKKEIERLNKKLAPFRVFFSTEAEIDAAGRIDYNEKILSEFDIVIASIHSGFNQSKAQLTKRIISACRNKNVDIIAHPTGVHIGKRDPYPLDFKEVCLAAADTRTALEINAFPVRLDLNSANVYFARKQGVRFAVNTDAHDISHLSYIRFGVAVARRGWLKKDDVVNTMTAGRLLKTLKKKGG